MSIPSREEWLATYNTTMKEKTQLSSPTEEELELISEKLLEAAKTNQKFILLECSYHRKEAFTFQPIVWLEIVMKLLREKGYNCEIMPYSKSIGPEKIRVDFFPKPTPSCR